MKRGNEEYSGDHDCFASSAVDIGAIDVLATHDYDDDHCVF